MGPSHITLLGLVSGTYEKLSTFHCSEDDMMLKIFSQFPTVSTLGLEGDSLIPCHCQTGYIWGTCGLVDTG